MPPLLAPKPLSVVNVTRLLVRGALVVVVVGEVPLRRARTRRRGSTFEYGAAPIWLSTVELEENEDVGGIHY